MFRHYSTSIAVCLTLLLAATVLPAQSSGRIAGIVTDPAGKLVPGARIELRDLASGAVRITATDQQGHYEIAPVAAGLYEVSATALHFAPAVRRDVIVKAGTEATVSLTLSIGGIKTMVSVTERAASGVREIANPPTARFSDTASLLTGMPGVSFYGNGGVSALPAIHGLADDRVRIILDGANLISACANHMNPPLSYRDPSNVGGIRVLAGLTPVSMGGDSIGGTIAVSSPAPDFAAAGQGTVLRGRTGTFYRSNGDAFGANLSFSLAGETMSMRYAGSVLRSGNYTAAASFKPSGLAAVDRGWLEGNVVGSSRYASQNHALAFALQRSNQFTEILLDFQNIPYQGFPTQRMDMTLNDNARVNLHQVGRYSWGTLDSRAYVDFTRHKMDFGQDKQYLYGSAATFVAYGMPMSTKGLNIGAVVRADIQLSNRDALSAGFEAQRYRLHDWWPPSPSVLPAGFTSGGMAPNTFININNGRRDRIGVFAEWERWWTPRWTTLLGGRSDTVLMNTGRVQGYNDTASYNGAPLYPATTFNAADRKRTDANFDVTALTRYTPRPSLEFEAGYARKTHSPNLYERYAWSTNRMAMEMINFAGDGNFYVGNLGLSPEVAHTASATARWHSAGREIAVTPYLTYVHDYIDARRCPTAVCGTSAAVTASATATTGFVYLQFANRSARLYGFDLSGRSALARTPELGSFALVGGLSFVRGENRTTRDNLYNIMPVSGRLAIVHTKGKWSNTIEQELVGAKTRVSQVRNELRTGGYGLMNLRGGYAWGRARLDAGVENLLNKFYAPPLGGVYAGQGMTMSGTGVPWGVPVRGMGRSFYLGLTWEFSTD